MPVYGREAQPGGLADGGPLVPRQIAGVFHPAAPVLPSSLSSRAKEADYAAQFEAPELLTLGIVYSENKRFAGGAYSPFLRKVDRFSDRTLRVSLREREGYAARLQTIDTDVKKIIAKLQAKGFKSPYLRAYVVARINPIRFHRAKKGDTTPPMTLRAALTRMAAAARKFDPASVKPGELALVAAVSGDAL